MSVIAVRVAHVVLHVSDQHIAPVRNVQCPIASDLDISRSEVGVGRDEDRFDFGRSDICSGELHGVLQHALESDRVADQEVAIGGFGEVSAREDPGGGDGSNSFLEPLLVASSLAHIDVASGATGAIVGELKPPAIEDIAVRVGSDREVEFDFKGPRVEAMDSGLSRPVGAGWCFHVGDIEDASRPVQPAVGTDDECIGRVVCVGAGDALEHADLDIGLVVAVGVFEEPDFRSCGHQHASAPELETGHAVELIGEDNAAVGDSVSVIIGQAENAVGAWLCGVPVRVGGPDRGEESSVGVDGHLHGVDQFGELFFRGEQVDFHPLGHGHAFGGLGPGQVRVSASIQRTDLVRLDFQQAGDVVVDDLVFATGGHGPDQFVAVGSHHVEDLHLALHHVGVGLSEPCESRAASEDVVAVDNSVPAEPVVALVEYRVAEPFDLGTVAQRAV